MKTHSVNHIKPILKKNHVKPKIKIMSKSTLHIILIHMPSKCLCNTAFPVTPDFPTFAFARPSLYLPEYLGTPEFVQCHVFFSKISGCPRTLQPPGKIIYLSIWLYAVFV